MITHIVTVTQTFEVEDATSADHAVEIAAEMEVDTVEVMVAERIVPDAPKAN
jgi:hypothetical protein